MQSRGYRIVPVNPQIETSLGEKAYPSLSAACAQWVRLNWSMSFALRNISPTIVKDAIRLKIPYLWIQEGVVTIEAAAQAEAAGY